MEMPTWEGFSWEELERGVPGLSWDQAFLVRLSGPAREAALKVIENWRSCDRTEASGNNGSKRVELFRGDTGRVAIFDIDSYEAMVRFYGGWVGNVSVLKKAFEEAYNYNKVQ